MLTRRQGATWNTLLDGCHTEETELAASAINCRDGNCSISHSPPNASTNPPFAPRALASPRFMRVGKHEGGWGDFSAPHLTVRAFVFLLKIFPLQERFFSDKGCLSAAEGGEMLDRATNSLCPASPLPAKVILSYLSFSSIPADFYRQNCPFLLLDSKPAGSKWCRHTSTNKHLFNTIFII